MPDRRAHRGPHPGDAVAFAPAVHERLRQAVGDFSWLLSHGYADKSALKLVGDRFNLTERQRTAVMRCSCGDASLQRRREHEVTADALPGQPLLIDGYNLLTTVEAALAGGVIIEGRDGCYRDMASMHGTFRKVQETVPALGLIAAMLSELGVDSCMWYLDRPVSNSGRLKSIIQAAGEEHGQHWQVELASNPDAILAESRDIVATADSAILGRCQRWFNLARHVIGSQLPEVEVVSMRA